jgi:D-inositol-3-phosphate glycosyltransferase
MRRVAMISEHANPVAALGGTDSGGQNVYVEQVSRGVARLGFAVDVYTRADNPCALLPRQIDDNVWVIPVSAGPLAPIPKDAIWPYLPEFLTSILRLASQRQPYDLIHGNFWMSGWLGAELKSHWQIPLVQIFHALGIIKRQHQGEADTSPPERFDVECAVLRAADRIIAQCPSEVEDLATWYGADLSKIQVVPSGVDIRRFFPVPTDQARRDLGLRPDQLIAVYVGRLVQRKGIENVIRAIPKLEPTLARRFQFLVVGGETAEADLEREPEISRLAQIAAELGVRDRVTFVGHRPTDILRIYYSAADVFVSTPWYEPYGLTPLEAMACGTPVICSAVGGIKFTVAHGETGFLVKPEDSSELAQRLTEILADPVLRRRFSANARSRVEHTFTWPIVAQRTAELYLEVLRERCRSGQVA